MLRKAKKLLSTVDFSFLALFSYIGEATFQGYFVQCYPYRTAPFPRLQSSVFVFGLKFRFRFITQFRFRLRFCTKSYFRSALRLDLSQNAVHNPVGGSGADAGTRTDVEALQMTDDALDKWQLDVGRIGDGELVASLRIV